MEQTGAAGAATARARVAHRVPGRLRIRFERDVDVREAATRLQGALAQYPGVQSVQPHPSSHCVVVRYSTAELEVQRLIDEGLPAAAVELLDQGIEAIAGAASGTAVGRGVVKGVGAINNRLERATGGVLDLRDVFPLTLFGLGIRRLLQGELQPIPWYNLLYYGYSTFAALHGRRSGSTPPAEPDSLELLRRRYARGEIDREEYRQTLAELTFSIEPEQSRPAPLALPAAAERSQAADEPATSAPEPVAEPTMDEESGEGSEKAAPKRSRRRQK